MGFSVVKSTDVVRGVTPGFSEAPKLDAEAATRWS
jgi:hypothetical protein